jgi:hypothetical protein
MTENERFGLVFTKTGSINSGTGSEIGGLENRSGTNCRFKMASVERQKKMDIKWTRIPPK